MARESLTGMAGCFLEAQRTVKRNQSEHAVQETPLNETTQAISSGGQR